MCVFREILNRGLSNKLYFSVALLFLPAADIPLYVSQGRLVPIPYSIVHEYYVNEIQHKKVKTFGSNEISAKIRFYFRHILFNFRQIFVSLGRKKVDLANPSYSGPCYIRRKSSPLGEKRLSVKEIYCQSKDSSEI